MRNNIISFIVLSVIVISLAGCSAATMGQYQIYADRAQKLGLNFNSMPLGVMDKKLQERGYVLLDEYRENEILTLNGWERLYVNQSAGSGNKYIVTAYQPHYSGNRGGWQIIAIDDMVPAEWKGKSRY